MFFWKLIVASLKRSQNLLFYIPFHTLKVNKSQNVKLAPLTFLKDALVCLALRHKMWWLRNISLSFYLLFLLQKKINSARKTSCEWYRTGYMSWKTLVEFCICSGADSDIRSVWMRKPFIRCLLNFISATALICVYRK